MHLVTRGNNKILHTSPPHISSSEEIHSLLNHRTLAQLRLTPNHIHKHYDTSLTPTLATHDTHHLFNCTHMRTMLSHLDLWTDPAGVTKLLGRWTAKLAGGP